MADILDILSANQCQAVSVTVFEASRSPQAFRDAFRDAFVCYELPEVGTKIVCQPEHREAICRLLIEHDVQVRKPRYIIVADEFVEMVHGVISTIRRKEKIKLKKLEQVTIPVESNSMNPFLKLVWCLSIWLSYESRSPTWKDKC